MNRTKRIKLATEIGDRVRAELIHAATIAPEDWDGFEIRWALTELAQTFQFKTEVWHRARLRLFRKLWRNLDMLERCQKETRG